LMMFPALDQKLPYFHVLISLVITVYTVKMLVFSVSHAARMVQ